MKLRASCVCRNEADIIRETLLHAATFCDEIYVYDLGSTDGTAEIVRELEGDTIRLFDSISISYHDGRHADVWQSLWRENPTRFDPLDWYMILDADEQLVQDPKPVLFNPAYRWVNRQSVWQMTHFFTPVDYQAWAEGDRRPCSQRLRYFQLSKNLEPRFFRCTPDDYWWASEPRPGYPHGCRMPTIRYYDGWSIVLNRHFQYRSPDQIRKRFEVRVRNKVMGGIHGGPQWHPKSVENLMQVPVEENSLWDESNHKGSFSAQEKMRMRKWSAQVLVSTIMKLGKDKILNKI